MPDPKVILEAVAAAGALAALFVLLCGWPWKAIHLQRGATGWAMGVGAGFFVGCAILLGGLPNWPPVEDVDRLLFVLLPLAVGAELIGAFVLRPRWLACVVRGLVAAAAGRILLHHSVYIADSSEWTVAERWQYLIGMGVALAVVWNLLVGLTGRAPSRAIPLALAMTCGAAGVTIMLSGSLTDGQLGFALAGALAGAVVASLAMPCSPVIRGGVGVGIVGLFALVVMGRFFSELTTTHAVLLFCAPLACWVVELPHLRALRPWLRGLIQLLLVAVPLAIVVVQAQRQFTADSQGKAGNAGDADDPYAGYGK